MSASRRCAQGIQSLKGCNAPSSPSSLTSAYSYPIAKSRRSASASSTGLPSSAAAIVDLPVDDSPRIMTCFDGMDRDEETESRIEDHKS